MNQDAKLALNLVLLIGAAGAANYFVPIPASPGTPPSVLDQLQHMGTLAVFIERSVEVYLGVAGKNGPERIPLPEDNQSLPPAKRDASLAALVLGLLLALIGVRILPSVGLTSSSGTLLEWIRSGVDVLISGLMMGGGSLLIHEVSEAIKGGIRKVSSATPASGVSAQTAVVANAAAIDAVCAAEYDANKGDCSKFAIAVAARCNVTLMGPADSIVDQIGGPGWTRLTGGPQAKVMAEAGMFVVAGLKAADHTPAAKNGHVAIVVAGPLAYDKYPTGYWGSIGGTPGKKLTLNYAWIEADRDKVIYAAKSI